MANRVCLDTAFQRLLGMAASGPLTYPNLTYCYFLLWTEAWLPMSGMVDDCHVESSGNCLWTTPVSEKGA